MDYWPQESRRLVGTPFVFPLAVLVSLREALVVMDGREAHALDLLRDRGHARFGGLANHPGTSLQVRAELFFQAVGQSHPNDGAAVRNRKHIKEQRPLRVF